MLFLTLVFLQGLYVIACWYVCSYHAEDIVLQNTFSKANHPASQIYTVWE